MRSTKGAVSPSRPSKSPLTRSLVESTLGNIVFVLLTAAATYLVRHREIMVPLIIALLCLWGAWWSKSRYTDARAMWVLSGAFISALCMTVISAIWPIPEATVKATTSWPSTAPSIPSIQIVNNLNEGLVLDGLKRILYERDQIDPGIIQLMELVYFDATGQYKDFVDAYNAEQKGISLPPMTGDIVVLTGRSGARVAQPVVFYAKVAGGHPARSYCWTIAGETVCGQLFSKSLASAGRVPVTLKVTDFRGTQLTRTTYVDVLP